MMLLFIKAFGLGIALCTSPGAVTVQVIRRGLNSGFWAALTLQLGALLGIVLWAVLAFIGVAVFVNNVLARVILSLIGVVILLWLAWKAFRDTGKEDTKNTKVPALRDDFMVGVAFSLANPLPAIFWMGIGSTLLPVGDASLSIGNLVMFFAGFLLSTLLCNVILAGILAWGRKFVTPRLFRAFNVVSAIVLVIFAISMLWSTIPLIKQL